MARLTHMNDAADRHGFVVAYPDGLDRGWADGRGATKSDRRGVDDVAFLSAVIEDVARAVPIDRDRIFATGMSNGGFMSQRLACEMSDRIAAIAVVAALMGENVSRTCVPRDGVGYALFYGTADPFMPVEGGQVGGRTDRGRALSVEDSLRFWNRRNRCGPESSSTTIDPEADDARIVRERWIRCAEGREVRAYRVEGGGHAWPGGSQYLPAAVVGRASRDLDASEEILAFFETQARR